MDKQLKSFTDRILSINGQVIDLFSRGMPGLAVPYAAGGQGMGTSGGDVTQQLKNSVIRKAI